ncbi:MAG TPA: DUF4382 domain-containing protein [Terriglobia bacterium]|nr:DUF4382 domain-containing protein [Terriglobia bacterium]
MRKHVLSLGFVGSLLLILTGCGSTTQITNGTNGGGLTGSVAIFGTDAPLCDVFSFQVTISGATLTPANGGAPVSVITSANPITVDFARLQDFGNLLQLSSVPTGTYSQLNLTLSAPQLWVLDVTQSPPAPVQVSNVSLTTSRVSITLQPQLMITEGKSSGLMMDFNLQSSVQTDANGQVTGVVDPVFRAGMTMQSTADGVGRADDLHGVVQSVSTTSSNAAFTGSFTLQVFGGAGPVFTINTTSTTRFEGVTGLSGLSQSAFAEVDSHVDTSGNIIADAVEVEDSDPVSTQRAAFLGRVISVTRDLTGAATQFTIVVAEEFPDLEQTVPLRSPLTVTVSGTTFYAIGRPAFNEAGLNFNAKAIGVAETVVARGLIQSGPPVTLNAGAVVLRPRTVLGHFSTLLAAAGDGKTGGFTMIPCGSLFQGSAVNVLTFNDTIFDGFSSLAQLGPQPLLGARGLVIYQQTPGSANGASWTAPTWVLESHYVHQH